MAELARLRREGVRVGLTLSGPRQAEVLWRALEIEVDGESIFDTVQATWNLLERSAEPALRAASERGMGVIVKEALANGRLTARNHDADFGSKLELLTSIGRPFGAPPDAVAIAAALAHEWADVVLSGAAAVEHLESNLQALDLPWNDEMAAELGSLAEDTEGYWSRRARLPWN
jgi:aryl-alcohol dehydrogenase-like predicted oxidoreductase